MGFSIPAATVLALAAAAAAHPGLRITVAPAVAPIDAPVVIRIAGLRAGGEVTVRARLDDAQGRPWRSEAVFRADDRGVVDVDETPSRRGTYTGVQRMGLFWSMRPPGEAPPGGAPDPAAPSSPIDDLLLPPATPPFARPPSGVLEVRLEAQAAGGPVVSATALRQVTTPGVKVAAVAEAGLVGRVYEPPGQRLPAVLVLGGAPGGIPTTHADVLAGHGYVTLALACFRAEGLPPDLADIPLESLKRGLDWLRARPAVDPGRIAVLGHSRGAEAALLLGSAYAEVKAVVALSPTHVVWEGVVRDPHRTGLAALKSGRSAWTLGGHPVPFVPRTVTPEVAARVSAGERLAAIDTMRLGSVDLAQVWRARITVENIGGPVLLVSSLADRTWPSAEMADRITEALHAGRFPYRVEHLRYDDLGHVVPDAWLPPLHGGTLGGSAEGTMRAFGSHWPALLAFLDASLRPSGQEPRVPTRGRLADRHRR
jgi:dienelactone hydrolase